MLIGRAPLRITLGGGGTDLPSYYEHSEEGGFCITAAIDKYVVVTMHRPLAGGYTVRYRTWEEAVTTEQIRHPIVRAALSHFGIDPPLEIGTHADVPAGSGLGSSAAFTVALIQVLSAGSYTPVSLAEEAFCVETRIAGQLAGKQDAYASALGGIQALRIDQSGRVRAQSLPAQRLQERLLMFYTGLEHSAPAMLASQHRRAAEHDRDARAILDAIYHVGVATAQTLNAGSLDPLGELFTTQWQLKLRLNPEAVPEVVATHWEAGICEGGADGGKLVGAGGGGFLLFVTRDPEKLRATMRARGLCELPFRFEPKGAGLCYPS